MPEQEISAHSLSPEATAGLYDRIDELLSEIDQACDDFEEGGTPMPPMPVLRAAPPVAQPKPAVPTVHLEPELSLEPEPELDPEPKQGSEPTQTTDVDALVEPESVQEDASGTGDEPQDRSVDDDLNTASPDLEAADDPEAPAPVTADTAEPPAATAPAAVDPNQSLLDSINAQLANLHAPSEPEVAKPPTPEPELAVSELPEHELPEPELAEPELPAPPKAAEPQPTPEPAKKSAPAPAATKPGVNAESQPVSSSTDLDPLDASDLDDIIAELDAVDAGHGRKSSEPKLPTPIPSVTADETDLADEESFDDSFDHDALDEPAGPPASPAPTSPTKQVASAPTQVSKSSHPDKPKPVPPKQPAAKASKPPRPKPADVLKRLEPVFYRAGTAALTPLAGVLKDQPRVVRDTLGWVAASTVFYGIILWSYVLIFRSASQPDQAPQGVTIVEQDKP
jgi:hypothetical protein